MYPACALDMADPSWDSVRGGEHCCLHLRLKLPGAQLWHLRCECVGRKLDHEINPWRDVAVSWIGDVYETESSLGWDSPWTDSDSHYTDSGCILQVWAQDTEEERSDSKYATR